MPDETIETAAKDIQASWIADGTPAAEPVTTETPAEAQPAVERPRGPDGKFIAAETPASATPTPASPASAPATAVPPAGATAQQVQEFIEARLGESETFQIPKGVKLPLKRGDKIEYAPVEEVLARGMMELDYRHKTAAVAQQRRDLETRDIAIRAEQAKVEARDKWLAEREAEMREAMKDPQAWEAYLQMQVMYQTNPRFRQTLDDALAKRETDAENAVYRERDYQDQVRHGTELAAAWITDTARDFPNVDPERVRTLYAQALSAGSATLDPSQVRAIYQQEADYVTRNRGPLEQQLAELKQQVERLTAGKAAEAQNATTQHAVNRAKAPPVATTGAPPTPVPMAPKGRFGPGELADRNQEWVRQR